MSLLHKTVLRLIVHNQPPEKAWTTEWSKEYPTVLENNFKKGKVIFFSNQPDQITYDMGHPDVRNLLVRSLVIWQQGQYVSKRTLPKVCTLFSRSQWMQKVSTSFLS